MVGPEDASDIMQESIEEERQEHERVDRFRRRAALFVGIMAAALAITALGGDDADNQIITSNILASDTFAFFQAKNIRQTSTQLAADALEAQIMLENPPPEVRAQLQQRIDRYKATVARYESEPETGEGKRELLETARAHEADRDEAQRRDPNFDYAQALIQIAIVLGSVAIIAVSPSILALAGTVGGLGAVLTLNGFMLLFDFPL